MTHVLVALVLTLQAPAGTQFLYTRPVFPGGAGPNRLDVDAPLLAGAAPGRGFADLRLQDGAGREVPYLLIEPARLEAAWAAGGLRPIAPTEEASGFEVDLGEPRRVDRLRLGGVAAPFMKRFRLEASGDRSRWTVVVGEGTLFDLPEEGLTRLEVSFPAEDLRYFRVTWDDRMSGRLPLPRQAWARLADPTRPAPALRIPLPVERRPSEPRVSRYRLRLPGPHLPLVAIELGTAASPILRAARVSEARLGRGVLVPVELGRGTLRRAERHGVHASDLRIPIREPSEPLLELVLEDGDNPPLAIDGAHAECRPLPWIYFESPAGEPLAARFGSPRLAAPRYDLEAVRPRVAGTEPLVARWGERSDGGAAAGGAPEVPELVRRGAPLGARGFRYVRQVPEGAPGLVVAALDAAVLAHSRALSDLRLLHPEGYQVPYLVEEPEEPLALELGIGPVPPEDGGHEPGISRYAVELPHAGLPGARLVLETGARVFERQVSLERVVPPPDRRSRPGRQTLAGATWRHADRELPPPALVLDLPSLDGTAIRIRVSDGDNAPLPIEKVRLLLPARRLRFFRTDAGALEVRYGNPGLPAPRYDLELLARELLGVTAVEVSLGPEQEVAVPPAGPGLEAKLFWVVLAAVAVVLLLLLARLLGRGAGAGS